MVFIVIDALIESETKYFGYYSMTGRRFKTRYMEHMGDIRLCHERNKEGDSICNGSLIKKNRGIRKYILNNGIMVLYLFFKILGDREGSFISHVVSWGTGWGG